MTQTTASSFTCSSVKVLSLVQDLLPSVSELNSETQKGSRPGARAPARLGVTTAEADLPAPHYAWVESEHPYKPAGLWNYKVRRIIHLNILGSVRFMSMIL